MIKREDLYKIRVETKGRNSEVLDIARKYDFVEGYPSVFNKCKYLYFREDYGLTWSDNGSSSDNEYHCITVEELLELVKSKEVKTYTIEEDFIKQAHSAACSQWKTKIEEKFPEVFPKITYKVGDRFNYKDVDTFLLVSTDDKHVALFNTSTGGRWDYPKEVTNVKAITEKELKSITDASYFDKFKLIK